MWKHCLVLLTCLLFTGCTTLQHASPEPAPGDRDLVEQAYSGLAPAADAGDRLASDPAEPATTLEQNLVEPKSGGWALLGSGGAMLFFRLLSLGAAGAACC